MWWWNKNDAQREEWIVEETDIGGDGTVRKTALAVRGRETIDRFKRIIDVLNLIVITCGFFFTIDQAIKLKESIDATNKATALSTLANMANQTREDDQYFIDNPGMTKYFEGINIREDDPEDYKVKAVATGVLDHFDNMIGILGYMEDHMANSKQVVSYPAWEHFITVSFKASPILCKVLNDDPKSYGPTVVEIGQHA